MIEKLKEILFTQLQLMGELLALLKRETPELLGVNLEAIAEINDLKESTTARIEEYTEPLRQTILDVIASFKFPKKATLVEVVTLLGQQGYEDIPRLFQDLNTQAKQVQRAAAVNQEVAEISLSNLEVALIILAQLLDQSWTYCFSGKYEKWLAEEIIFSEKV